MVKVKNTKMQPGRDCLASGSGDHTAGESSVDFCTDIPLLIVQTWLTFNYFIGSIVENSKLKNNAMIPSVASSGVHVLSDSASVKPPIFA